MYLSRPSTCVPSAMPPQYWRVSGLSDRCRLQKVARHPPRPRGGMPFPFPCNLFAFPGFGFPPVKCRAAFRRPVRRESPRLFSLLPAARRKPLLPHTPPLITTLTPSFSLSHTLSLSLPARNATISERFATETLTLGFGQAFWFGSRPLCLLRQELRIFCITHCGRRSIIARQKHPSAGSNPASPKSSASREAT
jgi:hypothetical protein